MTNSPLKRVIDRINATYGSWSHNTTIETMRADWDKLFSSGNVTAQLEDLEIDGMACRWVRAATLATPAIVLYIHGGGFRLGSIDSHQKLMSDIACTTGCQVLGFNFRLMPENKFPSPLDDTVKAYLWLLAQGYFPERIIIAGDSAGGGLAAGLLQLCQQQRDLPMPAGMVLLSPWLDMTLSGNSYNTRAKDDPVHQKKMLQVLAGQYAGKSADLKNPLLSPLFGDLNGLPPTLIQMGDCEVGLDDAVSYSQQANASASVVDLSIWPDMIHVFQMFADELEPGREAIQKISTFIKITVKS